MYDSFIENLYIEWKSVKSGLQTDLKQKYKIYKKLNIKYGTLGLRDDVQDSYYELRKLDADLSDDLGYRLRDYLPRYLCGY
jgi:hypothetical protein